MATTGEVGGLPLLIANLDAVAVLREASPGDEPDPVQVAAVAEAAGAGGIAVRLRDDRRFITDRDVRLLKETVKSSFSLAITPSEDLVTIAETVKPDQVTLVPAVDDGEPDEQDPLAHEGDLRRAVDGLRRIEVRTALLVQPNLELVKFAAGIGADGVTLHIGAYAAADQRTTADEELEQLRNAADYARKLGLSVRSAGGTTKRNCEPLFDLGSMTEHEVGHGLAARALLIGFAEAVREFRGLMRATSALVPQYRA